MMRRYLLILFMIFMAGCAGTTRLFHKSLREKAKMPTPIVQTPVVSAPAQATGSLWTGESNRNMLFVDNKARTVNDIVTIDIVESSTATKKASTKLGRSSQISAGMPHLFGQETRLDSRLSRLQTSNGAGTTSANALDLANILGASTKNDFDGSGETTRSGKLSGKMTAIVTEVLPNGNLKIRGRRLVTVNGEEQIMVLTGTVRPDDISAQNIILSTFIADASISYYGMGVVGDKQRPGWLARGFDKFWPF
ncbi:MAG: flagellar basal body L-ring protein FlgH [Deltaproteobacteria bacterium]|nr:flagellar basal body L-ring protein FlgH [Deltaproteobacteria bacterium]